MAPLFLALLVAFMWSFGGILQKFILSTVSPTTLMILSAFVYASIVVVYAITQRRTVFAELQNITLYQWMAIVLLASVSMFFSMILYYKLLRNHDVHKVNALTYTAPAFTVLMAIAFLKEHITLKSILGIFLIVTGAASIDL